MSSELQALVVENLPDHIAPPEDGILSVTLQQEPHIKVVLFAFAAGQELSQHTASVPAIMQQISGDAHWQLGEQEIDAEPGTWASMPAHLPHSLTAKTACVMLLTMLRSASASSAPASSAKKAE
jgi:quercetin dioxygenase-like cupin family protein